ncbi:hypothetical protein GH714_017540 [Hevea brasiliensis]|uniref:Uncharacterized protein n=1 Tax=Hevea brasiliensis TaxID=3981 RepID=A0A6A6KSB7_HEVBR|nr:hypothetical protein GH714_017540 [Hevea brasiliensis]
MGEVSVNEGGGRGDSIRSQVSIKRIVGVVGKVVDVKEEDLLSMGGIARKRYITTSVNSAYNGSHTESKQLVVMDGLDGSFNKKMAIGLTTMEVPIGIVSNVEVTACVEAAPQVV